MRTTIEPQLHAFLDLAALVAALDLGLPAALHPPQQVADLASRVGVEEARLRALLDVLCRTRLFAEDDGVYALTDAGVAAFGDGPASIVAELAAFRSMAPTFIDLGATLREAGRRTPDPWPAWASTEGREPFAERTRALSHQLAALLPLAVDGAHRFVDLGCGAGFLAHSLLERFPNSRVTLVDRAVMVDRAKASLAEFGDRVAAWGGDFLGAAAVDLSGNADLVVVSNVLHSYGAPGCVHVLRTAARLLRPGGTVAVKDLRVDRSGAGPRTATDFSLHMAAFAPDGRAHTAADVRGFLGEAGFVDVVDAALPLETGAFLLLGRART